MSLVQNPTKTTRIVIRPTQQLESRLAAKEQEAGKWFVKTAAAGSTVKHLRPAQSVENHIRTCSASTDYILGHHTCGFGSHYILDTHLNLNLNLNLFTFHKS
jgi:hypothetical protein